MADEVSYSSHRREKRFASALSRKYYFTISSGGGFLSVVRYENLDVEYETEIGDSILDADLDNGVDHTCDCGGNCACSTCKVVVISGAEFLSSQQEDEKDTLDAYGWNPDEYRLACQCIVEREGRIVLNMPEPE